jgi:TetR/AcrR family transcriptional regulator
MPEGERRARILDVAGHLFHRRGYAAVSIGDIAGEIGVTKAALYHHFPGKEALYTAVLRTVLEAIGEATRRIAEGPGSFAEKVGRLAEVAIVHVARDADMDSMLRDADEHLSPAQRHEIAEARRTMERAFEDLMREGIRQGELRPQDPHLLAHAFWQLLAGFGGRRGADAGFQGRPEVAAAVTDLFLRGAQRPARPRPP